MMGHKIVDCSASELTRVARDNRAQPAARRVAQHEIDRRRRLPCDDCGGTNGHHVQNVEH